MNLNRYIDTYFTELKIEKPLFYNWKNGLKFEIALDRAIKLFEYTFDKNDEIILVYQRYSFNRQKVKRKNFYLNSIDDIKLKKI